MSRLFHPWLKKAVLEDVGLWSVNKEYLSHHQNMVADYVVTHPIFHLCHTPAKQQTEDGGIKLIAILTIEWNK
jgi:hypothetical protein